MIWHVDLHYSEWVIYEREPGDFRVVSALYFSSISKAHRYVLHEHTIGWAWRFATDNLHATKWQLANSVEEALADAQNAALNWTDTELFKKAEIIQGLSTIRKNCDLQPKNDQKASIHLMSSK